AWTSSVMAGDLHEVKDLAPTDAHWEVQSVDSQARIDAYNALGRANATNGRALGDPGLPAYLLAEGDTVVARGQLLTACADAAHVYGIYTLEGQRRRGCCHAMMQALHQRARTLGFRRAVLAPSLQARRMDLYAKYGYRDSVPSVVLVPRGS